MMRETGLMTVAMVSAGPDGAGPVPAANAGMAQDLEVPRPLRLLVTAGWSLAESAGLPGAAYVVAAWLGGRDAGLAAGLAAVWLTAVIRKAATGSVPALLTLSALVLTVQTAVALATGELWLFLLQFPFANLCLCVVFARTARGPNPLVARLAADVVALRQPATHHPGLHRFFPGPAPLLPGSDLAVGWYLPAAHNRPGGADVHRAGRCVPPGFHRRHHRACRRRNRRIRAVVFLGAAQRRAEASFRPRLIMPAATGRTE
jgi:hypothetical protein